MKRYLLLRLLFSTEFALSTSVSEIELSNEWEEMTELLNDNCTQHLSENQFGSNGQLHSILCNLLMPYVASLHVTIKILLQVN